MDRRGLCDYEECESHLYDSCETCHKGFCSRHISAHDCGSGSSSSSNLPDTTAVIEILEDENSSQPQSSSVRNYIFRGNGKINQFFTSSHSTNVERPEGLTQRKVVSYFFVGSSYGRALSTIVFESNYIF
jgi:hypothetical protein